MIGRRHMKTRIVILLMIVASLTLVGASHNVGADDPIQRPNKPSPAETGRWWPIQISPKAIVIAKISPGISYSFTLQSVAGLAAKAVNENRSDELGWIETGNTEIEGWLARLKKRQPQLETRGTFDAWQLIERFARRNVIKGYILYRADDSKGGIN